MSGDSGHEGVPDLPRADLGEDRGVAVTVRALVSTVAGVALGLGVSTAMDWRYGLLLGWITGMAVFVAWTWILLWPMDAYSTARHAVREDPGRALADVVVVLAAVASLIAVGLLLTLGDAGGGKDVHAALSVASVILAWSSVHTMFTTRYARLYYAGEDGGIDFNETDPPKYSDFAYLAFTIGMTFQVSDTNFATKELRATALRHALLSYLFGTFIIASMINLLAGLGR
ncbi:DUF1345 domain-containing protein [Amycolatopsis sp.]|jgi:uncharacterized membrane protein|uniref:DUF1345 domain-containing protein n=1 Tax=Amycolatopsis sp. TaxID=37632 RepID=UPI002E0971F4|nr:DUF1345 domain-containing protein [Amycolatopsis sp.]